jgi:hypothetical protein
MQSYTQIFGLKKHQSVDASMLNIIHSGLAGGFAE